jgi:transcriptional regulator with XRE-family HTH domain
MEEKMNVNFYLKSLIRQKFITQEDFAQQLGEDSSLVSKVVNNRRQLPPEKQERWAEALGVNTEELFRG